MNRSDLHLLADSRVIDAEVLLQSQRWAAAYYLLGYAVECALKACASRQFGEHEVPDRKVVADFYTHELSTKRLSISGVKAALEAHAGLDADFAINWNTVRDWSETARYDHLTSEAKARDMYTAVTDPANGVLPWLKTLW